MTETTVRQYLKNASVKELDVLMEFIEKQREKQFAKENFGMNYAEFDAMIERARQGKFRPAEEVFADLEKRLEKRKAERKNAALSN
ncbi:hypothetical protein FWG95_02310 [Candidatus Saccharibacteria bacterium]|nr:hypothetical protein [Candidatus Saccharibacteria bacterium]